MKHLVVTEPLSYIDSVSLMSSAKIVLTDSGGIQEETTVLGIPCLTLKDQFGVRVDRPGHLAHRVVAERRVRARCRRSPESAPEFSLVIIEKCAT